MKSISPCLWFDGQAEEATRFYTNVFETSKVHRISHYGPSAAEVSGQKLGSVMAVELNLENLRVEALNGGPLFRFTPALSLFVSCATLAEIEGKWRKLAAGRQVRMELGKYPWAEQYGWTTDRFGVEWQLILAPRPQKIP